MIENKNFIYRNSCMGKSYQKSNEHFSNWMRIQKNENPCKWLFLIAWKLIQGFKIFFRNYLKKNILFFRTWSLSNPSKASHNYLVIRIPLTLFGNLSSFQANYKRCQFQFYQIYALLLLVRDASNECSIF